MKAIASGDSMIIERATVESELQSLGMQLQSYNDQQFRDKSKIQRLTNSINANYPAQIQNIKANLVNVANANLKEFISDRGVLLNKAVLIDDHIGVQVQKLRESFRLTQMQIGVFAGMNVYLRRFGSEIEGYIGSSINSGYEFNAGCQNPHSSLVHVVRNAIGAKLIEVEANLERDRQELPILEKRVTVPFEYLELYHEKFIRLAELKELFDAMANEAPVNEVETPNSQAEGSEETKDLCWEQDSMISKLEPPSIAIVEAIRQRTLGDWVSDENENWLEKIAVLVSDHEPVIVERTIQIEECPQMKVLKEVVTQLSHNEQLEQLTLF